MVRINSFGYLQQVLRRQGVSADTPHQAINAIITMHQTQSASQIAARLGVTRPTVTRWLKESGVAVRPRGGWRHQGKPVTLNGETRLWREWFPPGYWPQRERQILYYRIVRSGWPLERALTEPLRPRRITTTRQRRQREAWNEDENYDN